MIRPSADSASAVRMRPCSAIIVVSAVVVCLMFMPPAIRADDRPINAAQAEFLRRFDRISAAGYVPTGRPGDTGVGYTLETLLGVPENNDPGGDFLGIEVKAWRMTDGRNDRQRPMNLFLREPVWIDGLTAAERVRRRGYIDEQGRAAWYQTVSCRENTHGLRLSCDDRAGCLLLLDDADAVGFWTYDVLARRLAEKHRCAVFVGARSRGRGRGEAFHYRTVDWCEKPSVTRLLDLVDQGDIVVELRMHAVSDTRVRNHGTAFRVRRHRLTDLYESVVRLRPAAGQ